MATDKPRYTVSVDNELFQQIEDFRFANRYQTRSEATVELIRRGLETLKKEREEQDKIQSELDAYRAELEAERDSKTSQASDDCAEDSKMA